MNLRTFLLIFLSALLLISCKKADFDENHLLTDEKQKELIMKWGQSYNGRWDVYLLLKSMKEAKSPEEINRIYNDNLKKLDNAQLHFKIELSSAINTNNLGNLDTLYVKYYDYINSSLEKRTTMDSLWNIYSKIPQSKDASKANIFVTKRFYIEKPSQIKFKNWIDPVDVNVCTVFRQYEEAARLGGFYKFLPNPTCEMSALVAVHDYYERYKGENVADDPWRCELHRLAFSDLEMKSWNCQFEESPTDPYPPGNTGGGSGGGGSTGSSTAFTAIAPVVTINLQNRFPCFNIIPDNSSTTYRMTLHTHRGGTSSGDKPGHAYITLEKTNGSQYQRLTYGFYPAAGTVSVYMSPVASAIGEEFGNDLRQSDARYHLNLDKQKFDLAMTTSLSLAQNDYDLNNNNCVHYATDVFNAMNPPTGQINNNGFIIPDGLYVILSDLQKAHPSAEIGVGRMRPPTSTNCN